MKTYGYPNALGPKGLPADVLVIGGTSGIGEAIAKYISEETGGYEPKRVVATGIEDFQAQQVWWPSILAKYGHPTDIVYCAGENFLNWLGDKNATRSGPESVRYRYRDIFSTNVIGFIDMLDELAHVYTPTDGSLHKYKSVNVVAISSDAATRPLRTSIAYCASKAALDMAIRVGARELGSRGWRINGVAPGVVADTPMTAYVDKRVSYIRGWTEGEALAYEQSQEVTPGRVEKWEVAQVVSDVLYGPPHLNGAIIPVNGGR